MKPTPRSPCARAPVSLFRTLREMRLSRSMTVREVAEAIGKTAGYVSRIERSEIPGPALLCRLATLYDCPPGRLFDLARDEHIARFRRTLETRFADALAEHWAEMPIAQVVIR